MIDYTNKEHLINRKSKNKMYFISAVYRFKTLFRSIRKLTKTCMHLRNAIGFNAWFNGIFPKYCHMYIYNLLVLNRVHGYFDAFRATLKSLVNLT